MQIFNTSFKVVSTPPPVDRDGLLVVRFRDRVKAAFLVLLGRPVCFRFVFGPGSNLNLGMKSRVHFVGCLFDNRTPGEAETNVKATVN